MPLGINLRRLKTSGVHYVLAKRNGKPFSQENRVAIAR
jgi:hypothetical protein